MQMEDRQALQIINKTLHDALTLAANDFRDVYSLFRSCYDSHDAALRAELTSSGIAEDLQYMDILRQKVEHVVALHEHVENAADFKSLSAAIFKLNYFQIKVADFDFSNVVGRIRSKVETLWIRITSALGEIDKMGYLGRAVEVSELLERAANMLDKIAALCDPFPSRDLSLKSVSTRYSMDSERFVLAWFIEKQGEASYERLLEDYKNMEKSMSVEFF